MEIKELDKKLITQANNNSFGGKRGDLENISYKSYCDRAIAWGLSENKTQEILDKIYKYFSKSISLCANHVSVAVAGASNYNTKLDKSEKILENSHEFLSWFEDLEEQATSKKVGKVELLIKKIIWGSNGEYSTNKEWKELAARSRKDFDILFEELDKQNHYKKTTIPYKIYHGIIEVEQITQAPIVSNDDFCAFEEQGKIIINFRMKPKRQLIVALKSRRFHWNAYDSVWQGQSSDELKEWVKTISERYAEYI